MPTRPLLKLPQPEDANPPQGPRNISDVSRPSRTRQGQRLAPRFERLSRVVNDPQQALDLRTDPDAIAPERAIVFEIAGSVLEFYREASVIGFEYLADDELDIQPDDDFYVTGKPEESIEGRMYLAMPDVRALKELVRLWERFKSGKRMQNGFGMWGRLFPLLKDVRAWGPADRVRSDVLEYWRESLEQSPRQAVRFEVELWYRAHENVRRAAIDALSDEVARLGGRVVDVATISEIRYCAALVDLPAERIHELLNDPTISLARADEVMFIRPQSVSSFSVEEDVLDDPQPVTSDAGDLQQLPIAALLDGFPVQNHQRLVGRLLIDDPDGFEAGYTVSLRKHGTEMASLILHGDLNRAEPPLNRRLYVRPVLRPLPSQDEATPDDRLLVDLIYRAIRRIKEGDGDESAAAPSVVLVNLSLGDRNRPFSGPMSPWARLLDWLAFRHRILFLVSAGNVLQGLPLSSFRTWTEFEDASPTERQQAVLTALNANKSRRSLFSPAEALNVLTVGAAHSDAHESEHLPAVAVDPFVSGRLPNVSSALGLGHRKVVKPDILLDGGRELVRMRHNHSLLEIEPVRSSQRAFGLLAAAADPRGADLSRTSLTWGTSAATALATRIGHQIYDVLTDNPDSMHSEVPHEYRALLIKALLVHGAKWGDDSGVLDDLGPYGQGKHHERTDNIARFLGYGYLDATRVIECSSNRATLLGYGIISTGGALVYCVPLPTGLDSTIEFRAVTVTLAWFSPINPQHQGYRMAALEAGPGGDREYSVGVERARVGQPNDKAARRGTVFHERREGAKAASFVDNGDLLVRVSCRTPAGEYAEPVPYALAVSLEVGVDSQIQVYDLVRASVDARVRSAIRPE